MVFNQALSAAEDKFDLLANLIQAMNIDYSSDRETFSRLIRGRVVANMLSHVELGRLLYDKAEAVAKGEAFIAHQRAVFELNHPHGTLDAAEQAAARAGQLNPRNRSIRHTQAEIARRQAIAASDPLKKQSYRRLARARLSGDEGPLSEYDLYTRAKVALDELREFIQKNPKLSESSSPALLAAAKDAETAIQSGRAQFPENAEMLAAEADLREMLNQAPQALASLERAFRINPRQDWLAIRLAKRYEQGVDRNKAIEVIQRCLRDNPNSKVAHFEIARLLKGAHAPQERIIEHLRKSFTRGDNNFEGQFWFARELVLAGRAADAAPVFRDLSERAPGKFRTDTSAPVFDDEGCLKSFDGIISRKEEGYAFANIFELGTQVFASRADSGRRDWEKLRANSAIACGLAFNRRGPRLIRLTLRGI